MPVVHGDRVYARGAFTNTDQVLATGDGHAVGLFESQFSPAIDGNLAVFSPGMNTSIVLRAVDTTTDRVVWLADVGGELALPPLIVDGKVAAAATSGVVSLLDEATGAPLWSTSLGAPIGPAAEYNSTSMPVGLSVSNGRLFVPADNMLVAYESAPPATPIATPTPGGPPVIAGSLVLGPTIAVGSPSLNGNLLEVPISTEGSRFSPYSGSYIHLRWNAANLSFVSSSPVGGLFDSSNGGYCLPPTPDPDGGGVAVVCAKNPGQPAIAATGRLLTISLFPRQTGCSLLHLVTAGPPDHAATTSGTTAGTSTFADTIQFNIYRDATTTDHGGACLAGTPTPGTPFPTLTPTPTQTTPSGGPTPTPINPLVGPELRVGLAEIAGGLVRVPILISGTGFNAHSAAQVHLRWDPALFALDSVTSAGGLYDSAAVASLCFYGVVGGLPDADGGGQEIGCILLSAPGLTSTGLFATFVLRPKSYGCSNLHLVPFDPIQYNATDGSYTIGVPPNDNVPQKNDYVDGSVCNLPPPTATPTSSATPTATAVPPVAWTKSPDIQQVFLCENGTNGVNGCTTDGINGTVRFDEVLSNQTDPNGLGAYEFTLHYDNLIFNAPIITDSGVLGSTGRAVTCTMSILLETQVHWGCASTGLTPIGPVWFGPKVMAHVVFTMKSFTRSTLYPHKENGIVSRFDDTGTEAANICGQPLNDGTGYVVPGQTAECQGVLLAGILPGGLIADSHSFVTIRRLEGDLDKDCDVDIADMQNEASRYGFGSGSLLYQIWFDLEPHQTGADGDIDVKDIQFVFGRFGSKCSAPIPPQTPQSPVDP